jgi:adenylate cyclase
MKWQLHVMRDGEPSCEPVELDGAVDLGRQDSGFPKDQSSTLTGRQPLCYPLDNGMTRVVLASVKEQRLHRHIHVEPMADGGMFRLTNLSKNAAIQIVDGPMVGPSSSFEARSPLEFSIDRWTLRAESNETPSSTMLMQMLPEKPAPPGSVDMDVEGSQRMSAIANSIGKGSIDPLNLIRWLQAMMDVLQEAASSQKFLPQAARVVVELIGLDGCRVLLRDGQHWAVAAQWTRAGVEQADWRPSFQLLDQMRQHKRTLWQMPDQQVSVLTLTAMVVAPILNPKGEVIGALYGDRGQAIDSAPPKPITQLEAMLAEVLARGLAAGLARLDQEQAALRARVQLESFFTPELARQLVDNPEILRGRDAQVTILFCDLRKFSTNSEHLGPEATVEWVGQVMGAMSDCVQRHGGVVVDYIGDELMAMWGAPVEQSDHAQRACRAALEMLDHLPALNEQWNTRLKTPMDLGIGINSGVARVGNVGTSSKIKYGALGNTTNLASRVQGATKHLKTRLLITRATKDLLDAGFAVRRIGLSKVVNISEPVELFELASASKPIWTPLQMEYETALQKFESRNFRTAIRVLGNLLNEHPDDGPALVLLSRSVGCMVQEPGADFHLWELPGK